MKSVLIFAVVAVIAFAQHTRPTPGPCQICEYVVGQAEHHLHGRPVDKGELQIFLLADCESLRRFEGQVATDACIQLIDNNMDLIYTDVYNGKHVRDICNDLKQC
ncbi:unnamed protein product, partial [Mesorhabditis spiculigera]